MSPSLSQALMLRKSDQALCAAVRDGDEAAFAAIVQRYRPQLLRHCRSLLRDGHAEDAVQQTFVRALQALRSGSEVRELGPWLHRIARNVALTELSARGRGHAELSEEWEDRSRAGEFDRRADLREALLAVEALPDRQRTALVRSVAGDKPAVIAEQLGLSTVALRQLLHRARISVRAAVNTVLPPPLVWLSRRVAAACDRVPRAAGIPAGAAPVASKVALVVVASATVAAPATVIHSVLTHHSRPPARHRSIASRPAGTGALIRPPLVIAAARSSASPRPSAPAVSPPAPPADSGPAHPTPPSSQVTAVSASSPASAPVGAASDAGGSSAGTPIAAATNASPSGSASTGAGPVATASASGPTQSSSSSSDASSSGTGSVDQSATAASPSSTDSSAASSDTSSSGASGSPSGP